MECYAETILSNVPIRGGRLTDFYLIPIRFRSRNLAAQEVLDWHCTSGKHCYASEDTLV
jgi:hypothetical protein